MVSYPVQLPGSYRPVCLGTPRLRTKVPLLYQEEGTWGRESGLRRRRSRASDSRDPCQVANRFRRWGLNVLLHLRARQDQLGCCEDRDFRTAEEIGCRILKLERRRRKKRRRNGVKALTSCTDCGLGGSGVRRLGFGYPYACWRCPNPAFSSCFHSSGHCRRRYSFSCHFPKCKSSAALCLDSKGGGSSGEETQDRGPSQPLSSAVV